MGVDERRRRGALLCAQLAGAVAAVTPLGIEDSADAWSKTAPTDASFLVALSAWESDPTDRTRDRLRAAYCSALEAWRSAAAEYAQGHGMPR